MSGFLLLKMAKKIKPVQDLSPSKRQEEFLFSEVKRHSDLGFGETEKRTTGKGRIGSLSFDEADEMFRSWLDEENWPYDALLFDPRVFTFIFEKTSRLIAGKPKGRLTPREGADVLGAKVNNAVLDYQWDMANNGGSMLSKWALMDINARKYGAAFALVKWRYEVDGEGRVVYDGPEMEVLKNRDFAHDLTATSIENANWVQVRSFMTLQDLERVNDQNRSKPVYKNLDSLRLALTSKGQEGSAAGGDSRTSSWLSRNRQISHLEVDPYGKDEVYKTIEIVTEYRKDRWITFAPNYGVVIRDIPNPYNNFEIPVVMLRYYTIDDDLYGLSEIEPVKGLQKAVNALLCQYVDEINQNLYSPIAVGPGVRQHTLEWGKGARWIMNNPMTDFRLVESRSNAAQFFNNTYSVLVAAMMNALGESSLGVSNIQPYQNDKTATEVKALQLQRNARDNFNQLFLADSIKRQYMLWHSMNQVLLFSDPNKQTYIIRVAGKDAIDWFSTRGLGDMDITDEELVGIYKSAQETNLNPELLDEIPLQGMQSPKFPVNIGTAKEPKVSTKLQIEPGGDSAMLIVEPDDLKGAYDFSIDVETMTVHSEDERKQGRQTAISLLVSNPQTLMLLQQESVKPKFKDLFVTWLEDLGFSDAEKYFEKIEAPVGMPGGPTPGGGNIAQLLKQAGGPSGPGGQEGPQPEQNPGAGANQLAKVTPKVNPAEQQDLGQPNPSDFKRLVGSLAGGGNANGVNR